MLRAALLQFALLLSCLAAAPPLRAEDTCPSLYRRAFTPITDRLQREPATGFEDFQKLYQADLLSALPEALRNRYLQAAAGGPSLSAEEGAAISAQFISSFDTLLGEITKYSLTGVDMKALRKKAATDSKILSQQFNNFYRLAPEEQARLLKQPFANYLAEFFYSAREKQKVSRQTAKYIARKGHLPRIYDAKWIYERMKANPVLLLGGLATAVAAPFTKQLGLYTGGAKNSMELMGDQAMAETNAAMFTELAAKMQNGGQKALARAEIEKALGRALTDKEFEELFGKTLKRMIGTNFAERAQNIPAFRGGRDLYTNYLTALSTFVSDVYVAQDRLARLADQTVQLERSAHADKASMLKTLARQREQTGQYLGSFREQLATTLFARSYGLVKESATGPERVALERALELLTDPTNRELDADELWRIYYEVAKERASRP